jgi:hypothetical protein
MLLQKSADDRDFPARVLAADEVCFTRNGVVNFHNVHVWAQENPHAVRQSNFQQRFSINIWAGIVDNFVTDPHELPARLTGASYYYFLHDDLSLLLDNALDNMPLNRRQDLWFLHT